MKSRSSGSSEWSKIFPKPEAGDDDCLAVSRHLSLELLIEGYRYGYFPWPHSEIDGYPWFHPDPRAILEFSEIHVPRSLEKLIRRHFGRWRVSWNKAFDDVITGCKNAPRAGQPGTWITLELMAQYKSLHRAGYAHSLEVWEGETLIAGIYGVYAGFCFSAESMFHRESGASKFAVLELCRVLKEKGLTRLDIQMLTPHLAALGAREILREEFLALRETRNFSLLKLT